jgi:predicted nucleic acid-binding Zn ribbon protein
MAESDRTRPAEIYFEEISESMAKKKARRKRSTSETVFIVVGIIIALSMLLSLFVGLGSGARSASGNAPLPRSERFEAPVGPLGALDDQPAPLAMAGPTTTGPPA